MTSTLLLIVLFPRASRAPSARAIPTPPTKKLNNYILGGMAGSRGSRVARVTPERHQASEAVESGRRVPRRNFNRGTLLAPYRPDESSFSKS